MAGIPEEKLQELRDRIDIVDLVGRYVGLKRSGKNFAACCPFHSERTPSFYVNPERRSFKCFGCGVFGDGLEFVMRMGGKSFIEAARELAQLYGVQLPAGVKDNTTSAQQSERDEAYAITRASADLYREILLTGEEGQLGRLYQEARNITPETAEAFQLGYAPAPAEAGWDRLTRHLQHTGHSLPLAEKLGLVARSERTDKFYDKFRGRLMFPIIQPGGAVIAFSGRILPEYAMDQEGREAPKYMNSPESLLYTKGKTLFGLHLAGQPMRRAGRAILVEGNVDVVTLHQRGYRETVAPLGTALTAGQVALLARFAESVVLCFDGDTAGKKAARAAIPLLLDAGIDARIVALDGGVDPDTADPARLAALLEQPGSALEWLMRAMVAAGARDSIDAQDRALSALAPLLAKVKRDGARELYIDRAAKLLGLPPGRISSALQGSREAHRPPPAPTPGAPPRSGPVRPLPELPRSQVALAALLVDNPHLATLAEQAKVQEYVTDPRLAPIVRAVIEAAFAGERPGEGDLLELIDAAAHRQVHDCVFTGLYREVEHPQQELEGRIYDCQRDVLKQRRLDIADQITQAIERGEQQQARELSLARHDLNRQLAELERQPPSISSAAARP
ncbi:MAG: DNA primase [Nannocystis sp.]|nr:DNA primase [Nannocystis sp.]MBA3548468.1 DNA primase [Nannocystis sp.]